MYELPEPEVWTNERTAYFLLINSMTKEEWDSMIPDVIALGVDPARIDGIPLDYRDTLPTQAEWDHEAGEAKRSGAPERLSV